jgi:hypothetical protein
LGDNLQLKRVRELSRALFTQDDDLLVEDAKCQREDISFSGIIYGHQLRVTIGVCIHDLEIIAKSGDPKDLENQVMFLPL